MTLARSGRLKMDDYRIRMDDSRVPLGVRWQAAELRGIMICHYFLVCRGHWPYAGVKVNRSSYGHRFQLSEL
jgi:hypothetical protein